MPKKRIFVPVVILVAGLLFAGAVLTALFSPKPSASIVLELVSGLALIAAILFASK